MTSKERVRTALARKQPDRLPAMVSFNTETTDSGPVNFGGISAQEKIIRDLGMADYEGVLQRLGIDIRTVGPRRMEVDFDGKARLTSLEDGLRLAEGPEDIRALPWPSYDIMWDFSGRMDFSHLREDLQAILDSGEYAIQISGPCPWEVVRLWRGFDQTLIDWLTCPDLIIAMLRAAYDFYMPQYRAMAEAFGDLAGEIDVIYGGGDFGIQDRPMIDPKLFERDFVPMLIDEVKQIKELFPSAFFEFHCCGAAAAFFPGFVRAGVDAVHPVQPGCAGMEFETLQADWGDKLAFCGGVDAQGVMARGTCEDVRQWALHAFGALGRGGGYILAPHGIMPEVPTANVLSLFDTVHNECCY